MPIRPEYRKYYRGPQWQATRARILERSQHCCERCGIPNGLYAMRASGARWFDAAPGRGVWIRPGDVMVDRRPPIERGVVIPEPTDWPPRFVTAQLGIAHLNNVPGDDRDENLAAWCRECHLIADRPFHKLTRSTRKDRARPLLRLIDGGLERTA